VTDRLALAVRVIKARRRSTCGICRGVILPGQSIARVTGPDAWIHLHCVEVVRAVRLLEHELGGEVLGQYRHRTSKEQDQNDHEP
jgi:hypothetical protein